jgi:hypothetical protein
MAHCFQLLNPITREPQILAHVDDLMCAHFNVTPHPIRYYANWYNTIGLALACGESFEQIKQRYLEDLTEDTSESTRNYCETKLAIIEWLQTNYEAISFRS